MAQSRARRRLADLMDERRLELRLTWQEVAEHGGVSLRALANARTGDSEIRPLTQAAIEEGLLWERGSIKSILRGDGPEPSFEAEVWAEVLRHPKGAPADQIFSDRAEVALWSRELTSEHQRVREIAALRSVRARPPRARDARRAG